MDEVKKEEVAGLDIGSLPVNQEPSVEEPDKEKEGVEESDNGERAPETSEEENKVSYSRFKNIHTRYRESEKRAQELEARLAELESSRGERIEREAPSFEGEKYQAWKKLFVGENAQDTPQLREAYQIYMSQFAPPDESYIQKIAAQAYEQSVRNEERRVASNERTLDDQLEDLSISIGRDLTEEEQIAVLDIMDEFSAKDNDDRILSLYPAEKAWEMYEIQSGGVRSSRTEARNKVASLTSSGTRGETTGSGKAQEDKAFDPRWEALDASMSRRR